MHVRNECFSKRRKKTHVSNEFLANVEQARGSKSSGPMVNQPIESAFRSIISSSSFFSLLPSHRVSSLCVRAWRSSEKRDAGKPQRRGSTFFRQTAALCSSQSEVSSFFFLFVIFFSNLIIPVFPFIPRSSFSQEPFY